MYLGKDDNPTQASICPYFHTILWGSLLAVVSSPLLLFGVLCLRAIRYVLKFRNPVTDYINDKTMVGDMIEAGRDAVYDRPVLGGICTGIMLAAVLLASGLILFLVGFVLVYVVVHFPQIIEGLLYGTSNAAMKLGYAVFLLCAAIAWLLEQVGGGIRDAAIAVGHFLTDGAMWASVGMWCLYIIGASVLAAAAGWIAYTLEKKFSVIGSSLEWLGCRYNGYEESRVARRKEREDRAKRGITGWKCEYCGGKTITFDPDYIISADQARHRRKWCMHCGKRNPATATAMTRFTDWCGKGLSGLANKEICLPERPKWVNLGFLSVISTGFWAIKHRICPMMEFVSPEELQERTRLAVAETSAKQAAARQQAEDERKKHQKQTPTVKSRKVSPEDSE